MSSLANEIRVQRAVMGHSPIGPLTIIASEGMLCAVRFGLPMQTDGSVEDEPEGSNQEADFRVLEHARRELREYFEGTRRNFSLPLTFRGTPFQNRVWLAMCEIPFGETCSYSELARRIGSPKSARAVGVALGRNPIAIVAPCHRVIGADGSLVGFGGGLDIKRILLQHEADFT